MERAFLVLGALAAITHLVAARRRATGLALLSKPIPVWLCLAWVAASPGATAPGRGWIAAGLALSSLGDVLLALPQERFLGGLVAFLLAHVGYARAFALRAPPAATPWLLAAITLAMVGVLRLVLPGTGRLRGPVLAYVAAIATMVWLAGEAWVAHPGPGTLAGAVGAAVFMVSDSLLAIDRFRRPLPARKELVMGTYYAAQVLIARSCFP